MNKQISELYIKEDASLYPELRVLAPYLRGHRGLIAGGCFKDLFRGRPPKDLDLYFSCRDDWEEAVRYVEGLTAEEEQGSVPLYRYLHETKNAKTYRNRQTGVTLDLTRAVFGDALCILEHSDFSVTRFAYYRDSADGHLRILRHRDFFTDLEAKRLVIDGIPTTPKQSFLRVLRYKMRYGFEPDPETTDKLEAYFFSDEEDL